MQIDWGEISNDYDWISSRSLAHIAKNQELAKEILKVNPSKVVNLGCGSGVLEKELDTQKYLGKVIGIDSSEGMLTIARKISFSYLKAEFRYADLNDKLPFSDNSVDLVVSVNVIFCLNNPHEHLKEICRVLKQNGHLILVSPKPIGSNSSFVSEQMKGSLIQKIKEGVGLLLRIRSIIKLLKFDKRLSQSREGKSTYLSGDKIGDYLNSVGLDLLEEKEIQANQNLFFLASKKLIA